jgi:MFS transporter, DHA2 family, multidrug resistance protein
VPAFSASLAANALALFAVFGVDLFIAQYLQLVLGMGPFEAGLWTLPSAAGFIVGSMLAPVIARAVRPAALVAGGLAVTALGLAILTQVGAGSGLVVLVTGSVVMALGAAQVVTLSTDLIVGAAPPERAGTASGISETGTELGGALGIAILGSIGTAVYRSQVSDAVPDGDPSRAADAVRDTLGGAVGVADQVSVRLIDTATDAFATGLQVAAATSAILMLAMAVLAALLLRKAGPDRTPTQRVKDLGVHRPPNPSSERAARRVRPLRQRLAQSGRCVTCSGTGSRSLRKPGVASTRSSQPAIHRCSRGSAPASAPQCT